LFAILYSSLKKCLFRSLWFYYKPLLLQKELHLKVFLQKKQKVCNPIKDILTAAEVLKIKMIIR